ncbi:MAG: geranylgeranylglyceryl/heptaprenylglyceryl phosphate synthase [Crenarchaeota archaeon]|nr:geranylgeranylglyceryl/heptaprenylglyceryl phosphate synthase [Thermoproteota archaeon]
MGRVREYITREIERRGSIHITLLDPDKVDIETFVKLGKHAEDAGSSAIMVGGSLGVNERILDEYISELKREVSIPIILFPGNLSSISGKADALWFITVLNSLNTYYVIEAQMQASVILYKVYRNLETIPLAYLIVGDGGAVGFVSNARVIPFSRAEIILAYVLAARYLEYPFLYLEAGSGASSPVPPPIVHKSRELYNGVLIVGGGIREPDTAYEIARAGADIIVTGTVVEKEPEKLRKIVEAVHRGGNEKKRRDM